MCDESVNFSTLTERVLKFILGHHPSVVLFLPHCKNASNIYSLQNSYKKVTISVSSRGKY